MKPIINIICCICIIAVTTFSIGCYTRMSRSKNSDITIYEINSIDAHCITEYKKDGTPKENHFVYEVTYGLEKTPMGMYGMYEHNKNCVVRTGLEDCVVISKNNGVFNRTKTFIYLTEQTMNKLQTI